MENWKTIEDFPAYAISDLGRVKRILPSKAKTSAIAVVGRILKPGPIGRGYFQMGLRKEGKTHRPLLHRLVAKAFVPNPLNLPEVNHKGRKSDNRAIKLEWKSIRGHKLDAVRREQGGDGVNLCKRTGKYKAKYNPKPNITVHLGYFVTYKEAKAARDKAVNTL